VIVDINAVDLPATDDFVRYFKCAGKMNRRRSTSTARCTIPVRRPRKAVPGQHHGTWPASQYDDDKYGTVTLQQFAHSIGITLYEGMWISRGYSLEYPAEIKENMYFAVETFAGHPGLRQTCRLEKMCWSAATGWWFTLMEHGRGNEVEITYRTI
jgi:hypothetical protein